MNEERKCGGKFVRILGGMIIGIIILAVCSLVIGAVAMVLWNWLMPSIFGLGTIDYWQGFGIVLFAKLVFGGFGKHFPPPMPGRKWPDKRWGEYAKRRAFSHICHLDDDYEEWWTIEGASNFDEYMKKKDNEEEKKEQE